ncbi:39S ribosomal protein L22, mitochondrial [Lingula anatina]|uniref:39S ribosomal protein L22, mitochondrial n=1 Tax=Lingula anatina TaxID=7574 RepID=A0A1S3K5L2_LINAN|nr:39S ribosomal protein L22, mitochondrial [Lingula anatina]|eukprot:XP_013417797.1 39S ribosomal protein L22, mitochondrial [Lingula anatina]
MTSVISRIRPATSLFSRHLALSRSAAAGNSVLQTSYFHTSNQQHAKMKTIMKQAKDPPYYKRMNEIVYPPQKEGELRRPAEINHWHMRIKYSPDKMWYIACLLSSMRKKLLSEDLIWKHDVPVISFVPDDKIVL